MSRPAFPNARALLGAALAVSVPALSGCIGARVIYPVTPTPEQLEAFVNAGPPDVPAELELGVMSVGGPYRVVYGDLLSVELPPGAYVDSDDEVTGVTVKCRVKDTGEIQLPEVGDQLVVGLTLAGIEEQIANAYYDPERRLLERPNIVVTVSEYRTTKVAVIGAVNAPGIHELRSDHLTVVGALMAAGGIKADRGAGAIKVVSKDEEGMTVTRTVAVGGSDIPLGDLELKGGETVVVEAEQQRSFSVYGLVKKNGVFQYPSPRQYNLMQALATAGGVDENAAPRYATVYRRSADGSVLPLTFKIDGTSLVDGPQITIKDGDVIAVEHTQGSWCRAFFSQIFGFRASVNVSSSTSPTL